MDWWFLCPILRPFLGSKSLKVWNNKNVEKEGPWKYTDSAPSNAWCFMTGSPSHEGLDGLKIRWAGHVVGIIQLPILEGGKQLCKDLPLTMHWLYWIGICFFSICFFININIIYRAMMRKARRQTYYNLRMHGWIRLIFHGINVSISKKHSLTTGYFGWFDRVLWLDRTSATPLGWMIWLMDKLLLYNLFGWLRNMLEESKRPKEFTRFFMGWSLWFSNCRWDFVQRTVVMEPPARNGASVVIGFHPPNVTWQVT